MLTYRRQRWQRIRIGQYRTRILLLFLWSSFIRRCGSGSDFADYCTFKLIVDSSCILADPDWIWISKFKRFRFRIGSASLLVGYGSVTDRLIYGFGHFWLTCKLQLVKTNKQWAQTNDRLGRSRFYAQRRQGHFLPKCTHIVNNLPLFWNRSVKRKGTALRKHVSGPIAVFPCSEIQKNPKAAAGSRPIFEFIL